MPAIAFAQNSRDEVRLQGGDGQIVGALAAEPGMKQTTYISFRVNDHGADATEDQSPTLRRQGVQGVQAGMAVRRLTPQECERLQGFPDDYTLTPYRGKPAADGPRYKALGNSMAVPVMAWIGQRIAQVQAMP
jgi:DNA (cytosine-5)-methyltransferase 1